MVPSACFCCSTLTKSDTRKKRTIFPFRQASTPKAMARCVLPLWKTFHNGKTHLSIALGLAGCYRGYSVRFFTAAGLVTKLTEARDDKRLGRLTRKLAKANLLIVDELSCVSFPRHGAELLFQVISERSERGSVIINTNLDFSKWDEIFSDHMLAAALVDRITFKSHILNMNGDSYRLKHR